MRTIKRLILASVLVFAPIASFGQSLVSVPQDADFFDANMRWSGANAKGYDARMALKNMGGRLALCGVGVMTNIQLASAINSGVRGGTVKVNGKTVLKNFSFFAKAKGAQELPRTNANCKTTKIAVPPRRADIKVRYGNATFRN